MSKPLIFWDNCWIYMKRTEAEAMSKIIKVLRNNRDLVMEDIEKLSGVSEYSVQVALGRLLALKIVNVQQRKRARVYKLISGWEARLIRATRPFTKEVNIVPKE